MKPTRQRDDAVVDVLDVILEEGAMIQADVIVSVADIPLIGINLRAAIAGVSTMTAYGFFVDWDERKRAAALAETEESEAIGTPAPVRLEPNAASEDDGEDDARDDRSTST